MCNLCVIHKGVGLCIEPFTDLSHRRCTLCKCNNTYIHSEYITCPYIKSSNVKSFLDLISTTLSNFTHFWMRFNDITGRIYDGRHAAAGKDVIDYGPSEVSSGYRVVRREEQRFVIDI